MEFRPAKILRRFEARIATFNSKYTHVPFFAFWAIAIIVWAVTVSPHHLLNADAFDYAQMGRQIRSGHGHTTLQLFARHIPWLKAHGELGTAPPPNLYRYPLTPLASAAVQLAVPDAERATIIQSGIWFLLSIPLLYVLALEFASATIALLCVLVFTSQTISWDMSYSGLTESLATLLILAGVTLTFSPRSSRWRAFAPGAVCGLAYLCRTQLVFLLPWSILFFPLTHKQQNRGAFIAFLLLGAFVVLAPWFLRNMIEAGSPFFSFSNSRNLALYTHPEPSDIELQLMAPVALEDVLREHGGGLFRKIAHNFWPNILNPFASTANYLYAALLIVTVFTLPLLYWRRRRPIWEEQRRCNSLHRAGAKKPSSQNLDRFFWFLTGTVLLVLANFCLSTVLDLNPRFFMVLDPVLIVAGVQSIAILMRDGLEQRFPRGIQDILFGLALSVCAALFVIKMSVQFAPRLNLSRDRESYALLSVLAHGQGTVASDESYKIALYAGLQSVRFPSDPNELLEIDAHYLPIRYVVFSSSLLHDGTARLYGDIGYDRYLTYRTEPAFEEKYRFVRILPNGAELYRLRADPT